MRPMPFAMRTLMDDVMSAAEVVGRHVAEIVPGLRARANRWVRKPAEDRGPVSVADIKIALEQLGVNGARDLMVHASWAGMRQLHAKPGDLLAMFRSLVGERATLCMPAHPVEKYEDGALVYDPAKTPSRMGMLSETMRRVSGAKRSPLPIAPVVALGPDAEAYTRDCRVTSGNTPWGRGTPWVELCERHGQEIILGVDFVRSLTLMHCAFDLLGDENPIRDYYEPVDALVVTSAGRERVLLRRQRRDLEQNLATFTFRRRALASGTVKCSSVGGIPIAVVDARAFLDWHLPLARATGLPYWGFTRSRRVS